MGDKYKVVINILANHHSSKHPKPTVPITIRDKLSNPQLRDRIPRSVSITWSKGNHGWRNSADLS